MRRVRPKAMTRGASWDSIFLTIVKVVTTFTSIITTKILSVGLSLSDYGVYSQATLIISIGTSVLLFGLGDAINYFYNGIEYNEKARQKMVNTIYLIEIVIGIVFAAVLIGGKDAVIHYFSSPALAGLIVIISIKPMLDNIIYLYQILYISSGKARVIAVRNLFLAIIRVITVYIAVYLLNSVTFIFIALLIIDGIQLIVFKIYFARDAYWVNPFNIYPEKIKTILAYAFPMGIYALTSFLARDIDKLIIGYMADTETLAIYTNCSKILPFDLIATSFSTVLIPYIMKYVSAHEKLKTVKVFSNYMKIGYYSVWTFGFAVLAATNQVIPFLYSDQYLSGSAVFICYVVDSMIRFASMHLILTASGKAKILMWYSLGVLGINTGMNILLYKCMGTIGPAVATLFTSVLYTIAVIYQTNKAIQTKVREVFDFKDIVRTIVPLGAVMLLTIWLNQQLVSFGIHRYIIMFISMGIVGAFGLLWNFKRIKRCLKDINELC